MKVALLGQGFNIKADKSVGAKLVSLFADDRFHTFTAISAFSSQAGVEGVAAHIEATKRHLKDVTIITGIDQKATSVEALQALMALDIESYVFYQPERVIFHPKLYLFEGENYSALIIGSANLTALGLFGNVEVSIAFEIDNNIEEDYEIVGAIKKYFASVVSG